MKHTQTIEALYAAFAQGDVPSILKQLHPDVSWAANVNTELPAARAVPCYLPGRGHAFVAAYFQVFAQNYEVHEFQILNFLEGGNEVAVRLRADVTVRETGRRITGEIIHHYTLDGSGLVTRFLDFEDTLGFAQAWAA